MPYTYLLGWSHYGIYYYGRRTSKNCHPDELWVKYKTSSDYVKKFTKQYGDPDIIQIRKTFDCKRKCAKWESKVLRRLDAARNKSFLNKKNGDENWDTFEQCDGENNPNYGIRLYHNPVTHETIRCKEDNQPKNWISGYPPNKKHPSKGKLVYHNPETDEHRRFSEYKEIPSGWVKGFSEKRKGVYIKPSPNAGTVLYYDPLTNKKKYINDEEEIPSGFIKGGSKLDEDTKLKVSMANKKRIVFNNPQTGDEIRLKDGELVPDGYVEGRSDTFKDALKNSHRKYLYKMPHGEFPTMKEAYESTYNTDYKISKPSCLDYFRENEKVITEAKYYRSKYLKYFFSKDECVGKTPKECGFVKKG